MNKYDFGYVLEENSTNKWAFDKIKKNSKVLEIGASNGRLTKHLKEMLNSTVDIIEINESAGLVAKTFARRAFLGMVEGNVESPACIELLGEERYDYIVFLDVLEHLLNPQSVLQQLKSYLNDDGSILISVPNIAHNSVVINLMQNKFEYTELGILDDTHLHFFTNSSFKEMVKKVGFYITDNDAIQKLVGDTEIKNSYSEVPREVASYLRTREQADIYQILFELKKTNAVESNLATTNLNYTLYSAQVYGGKEKKQLENYFVNPKDIQFSVKINDTLDNNQLRIDPMDRNCIIRNLHITGKSRSGKIIELQRISMNGYKLQSGEIVFTSDDPQIIVSCLPDIVEVYCSCECMVYDTDALNYFEALIRENLSLKAKLLEEKEHIKTYGMEYNKLLNVYQTIEAVKEGIEEQYRDLEKQYRDLEKQYRDLEKQYRDLKMTN